MGMRRHKQKLRDLEALDKLQPRWKKVMMELCRHGRVHGLKKSRYNKMVESLQHL